MNYSTIGIPLLMIWLHSACTTGGSPDLPKDGIATSLSTPGSRVIEFYQWYLNNYNNVNAELREPQPILAATGRFELDTADYLSIIESSGFFSKDYLIGERRKYERCSEDLRSVNPDDVEECGCSPAEFADNCEWTYYLRWLFHQGETTNKATVTASKSKGKVATVTVCLSDSLEEQNRCISEVILSLRSYGGTWKIDAVDPSRD